MHDRLPGREVVAIARLPRQAEDAMHHGRHHHRPARAMRFDQRKRALRIEAVHGDDAIAFPQREDSRRKGRIVVERPGHENRLVRGNADEIHSLREGRGPSVDDHFRPPRAAAGRAGLPRPRDVDFAPIARACAVRIGPRRDEGGRLHQREDFVALALRQLVRDRRGRRAYAIYPERQCEELGPVRQRIGDEIVGLHALRPQPRAPHFRARVSSPHVQRVSPPACA